MSARRTDAASIEVEARANGGCMCPKCKTWNLKHRRKCVRCDKRLKPSPTMLKQEAARIASAAPDARSVGKAIEVNGRQLVMTKGTKNG